MSPHHTDLQGADELVDRFRPRLAAILLELQGKSGALIAETEGVRLALLEFVAASRAKYPTARCQRTLAGLGIGVVAKGPTVRGFLEELEEAALARTGLPMGVATPVPTGDERPTAPRAQPVVAREVDVTLDSSETIPLPPKPTIGSGWTPGMKPKPRNR